MIGALPARVDLGVYQGDDASFLITVTGLSLLNAVASAQLRRDPTDDVAIELGVTVESNTSIRLLIPAAVSVVLTGRYVWDLQVVLDTLTTKTLAFGQLAVTPQVTRHDVVPR